MAGAVDDGKTLAWGRAHRGPQTVLRPAWPDDVQSLLRDPTLGSRLVRGLGRSYGDSCLNFGGTLIETARLDRIHSFDRDNGQIVVESGFTLFDLLSLCVRPNKDGTYWFPPVLPGTKFVTVGGAIANDVHGKNHHIVGSFGHHVLWLELVRGDGALVRCAPDENAELFAATIGGLGLTGYIARAALQLHRVSSPLFDVQDIAMDDLAAFFRLSEDSTADWQYTVSWIDCLAEGSALGRGIFSRARHSKQSPAPIAPPGRPKFSLPVAVPRYALNSWTLKAFNTLYRARLRARARQSLGVHFDRFLFPLDGIGAWNKLYGPPGFFQYQCVVPAPVMERAIRDLLSAIAKARQGSFLAVLKTFGKPVSRGLLSFPMAGATLALDFPNRGAVTLALLDRLDDIVTAAGGRIYPAKDGRISAAAFQRQYPAWRKFSHFVDPLYSSSFWRRVSASVQSAADLIPEGPSQ